MYSLACVVINTSYEGTLKSHLTAFVKPKPINTVAEVLEQTSKMIINIDEELTLFNQIVESSPVEAIRTLPEQRKVIGRNMGYLEFYDEALKGYPLIATDSFAKYYIRRQLSYSDGTTDMEIVPQRLTNYFFTWHITRNSRFYTLINKRLLQLNEAGFVDHILKYETENVEAIPIDKGQETLSEDDDVVQPLKLNMLLLLYGSFGFGTIISAIVFCWENVRQ